MIDFGTAQNVLSIAQAIYQQVLLVQANKNQCQTLSKRVQIVTQTIEKIVQQLPQQNAAKAKTNQAKKTPVANEKQFNTALTELQAYLTEALAFVQQFTNSSNWFIQVLKAGTYQEEFDSLNKRLEYCINQLNLGLNIQQVIDHQQDKEDRLKDYQAIQSQQQEIIRLNQAMQQQLHGIHWKQDEQQRVLANQMESIRLRLEHLDINRPKLKPPIDPQLNVQYYDIAFDDVIGKGSFGTIYLGRWQEQPVAVKTIQGNFTEIGMQQFIREVSIMSRLRCNTITQLYGACLEPGRALMLMEYMENGSLYDALGKTEEPFPPERQHRIALDIARGLYYLHSQGVLHRDLKSANVLLNGDWHAKLADFGLSKIHSASIQTSKERSQAIQWLAPETFERNSLYTQASDIYGYGVILWEIMTGKRPYVQLEDDLVNKIRSGYRESIPKEIPEVYANIITQCWSAKPSERPALLHIIRQLQQYTPRPPSPKPERLYEQGIQHEQKQDYNAAFACYKQAANKGYAKAKTNLSTFFLRGIGGAQQDKRRAYALLLEAAQGGHPRAMHNLARMLEKGDGVAKDRDQALYWYEQGAKHGDVQSQKTYQLLSSTVNESFGSMQR